MFFWNQILVTEPRQELHWKVQVGSYHTPCVGYLLWACGIQMGSLSRSCPGPRRIAPSIAWHRATVHGIEACSTVHEHEPLLSNRLEPWKDLNDDKAVGALGHFQNWKCKTRRYADLQAEFQQLCDAFQIGGLATHLAADCQVSTSMAWNKTAGHGF